MTNSSNHKNTVRDEFTKQATAYAANPSISDPERIARLVRTTDPPSEARVLDIATGPGYVAFGFADRCQEVVGVDLTEAPLEIAEQTRQEHGVDNTHFQKADAENLPFEESSFDVVVCRFAFHHLEHPSRVLQQMTHVCRPNGTVVVEDLVVSEHSHRGKYQNEFEQHRDPSHVRAYSLSKLLGIFTEIGLEVEHVHTNVHILEVEDWLHNAQASESRATKARTLIEQDVVENLSGTRPFRRDGKLHFTHHTATIVGRQLDDTVCNN